MAKLFECSPEMVEATAKRNSSLQGAYLIMAARALGLVRSTPMARPSRLDLCSPKPKPGAISTAAGARLALTAARLLHVGRFADLGAAGQPSLVGSLGDGVLWNGVIPRRSLRLE